MLPPPNVRPAVQRHQVSRHVVFKRVRHALGHDCAKNHTVYPVLTGPRGTRARVMFVQALPGQTVRDTYVPISFSFTTDHIQARNRHFLMLV